MTTPFNLQPPTKNTNTASKREEPQQSLHVEIQGLYAKEIAPHIAPLQQKMRWYQITTKMKIVAIIAFYMFPFLQVAIFLLPSLVPSYSKLLKKIHNPEWLIISVGLAIFIMLIFIIYKLLVRPSVLLVNEKIEDGYKTLVIKPLLKHLNPALKIDVTGEFPQEVFNLSKLFTTRPDNYCSTELITDSHQAKFSLGFVHSKYVTTDSDGDTSTSTIFIGLMACIPCPKAMIGKTFVFTDDDEKKWGAVAKQLQGMTDHAGAKLVTMDNPDFEKAFQVYTTDSVQAHYLLSTKWLEKLTDFQRELKIPISIALHSGMCYVALHGYESPFTPQQDLEKALTASGVYTQYIRLKKLFDQLEILQQIGE